MVSANRKNLNPDFPKLPKDGRALVATQGAGKAARGLFFCQELPSWVRRSVKWYPDLKKGVGIKGWDRFGTI